MSEQPLHQFHAEYDLTHARQYPSKLKPASHQNEALSRLHRWFEAKYSPAGGILVLPTGGGKTFVAVRFICSGPLSQGYKVLWLAHTHHLLEQAFHSFTPTQTDASKKGFEIAGIAETKKTLGVRVVSGIPGHFPVHQMNADDDVIIATLQTITRAYIDPGQRAINSFIDSSQGRPFVIFDEAHHSPAPSYRKLITDLREANPDMYLLGLSATPTYTDEKKRGWMGKLFPQKIIYQVGPHQLMADKILAKPILEEPTTRFTPDFDEREYQKWVNTYKDIPENIIDQLARNRDRNAFIADTYVENRKRFGKTIIFADRWFQCDQLREMLRQRDVHADVIYSHVDADPGGIEARNRRHRNENAKVLNAFRQNKLDVLINVRMLTEGTDVPDVQTVFLTRQSTSKILLTQMVGRALRGPRFGGTEVAYIVSFLDDWKHYIHWASYDQLAEAMADDTIPEYGKRPPLQLISIELVRKLARQLDSGLNITPGPFLSLMPIGWYRVEFEALAENSEDVETVRQLVMVFEDEKKGYEEFIQHFLKTVPVEFALETIDLDVCQKYLKEWIHQFFPQESISADLSQNLLYMARHMAQKEGSIPVFFPFEDRDNHDLDKIVHKFSFEDNLGAVELDQALRTEYHRRDRYWMAIYNLYPLFKSQYDACVNRILGDKHNGGVSFDYHKVIKSCDEIPLGEPSEEVKKQVKARDGYHCLCCGESNKRKLQIDHVAPRYYGCDHSLDNLQTLCRICNQTKRTSSLNFFIHQTTLDVPPADFTEFRLPDNGKSSDEWGNFLQGSINLFYCCAAVESVKIGKRGHYFYNWRASLYSGNDPSWLQPYLKDLIKKINASRRDAGAIEIRSICITAPGHKDVVANYEF